MKYIVQYGALAMAILSGTTFLSGLMRLMRTYDFTHQRFASALLSASDTLLLGITCLACAKIYQLMVRSKPDAISKTRTEIELTHVGFLVAWPNILFMVHKMNLPNAVLPHGLCSFSCSRPLLWSGPDSSCGRRFSKSQPTRFLTTSARLSNIGKEPTSSVSPTP